MVRGGVEVKSDGEDIVVVWFVIIVVIFVGFKEMIIDDVVFII